MRMKPLVRYAIVLGALAAGVGELALLQRWRLRGWLHRRPR